MEPRTETERAVALIWSEVLNIQQVGALDGFFELGGHSLLATQVLSRIRTVMRVEVSLQEMFDLGTVEALAGRIDALVALRPGEVLEPVRASRERPSSLVPCERQAELSFAQQRLWFLDQYAPGSALYNLPAAIRLEGTLDVAALERAFTELVCRHQSLRTVFPARDGRPLQVVAHAGNAPMALEVEDLRYLPASEREALGLRAVREEARKPFDLVRGPLLRARLLRLQESEHLVVVTMHHIVSDAWSIAVLIREMVALYEAFSAGRASPLPELPIQYVDHAVRQGDRLRGEALERQVEWWRKQLDGAPPSLELPTDHPRGEDTSNPGAVIKVTLPVGLVRMLRGFCRQEGATLFMGLLAGLQALLARYSGQDDICVGAPVAGRTSADTEGLIGFFVNTLVLRTKLEGEPTFRELLKRVRETTLGAYSHQDVPFEKLVEVLQPERQPKRTPFFEVALVLVNTPMAALESPGLRFRPLDVDSGTSKFDFTLTLSESPAGLTGTLEYRTDLYEPASAERLVAHLERLMERAVLAPDVRLSELSLLTESDRRLALESWNPAPSETRVEVCAHELVEAQARRTPEAVAVVWGGEALTYAELERRANQLAWHLGALGVGAGERVGLCMERSLEQLVGLLGILKAGAAYVPLDAKYPAERLEYMVEDGGVARVLTTKRQLGALPAGVKKKALCVDEEAGEVARRPEIAPPRAVPPGGTCYVVYTSGSTGKPKGVALSHAALCNLLLWQRAHSVKAEARTLQFASLSFDVSFQEIFATWSAGGTLVVPPAALRQDVPALLDFMASQGVERLFVPFVALQALADAVAHGARVPESLREVVTAGEQLQVTPAVVAFFEKLPGCVLENQYGPSETHVVSAYRLKGPAGSWPRLPPIGVPLPDTKLLVLDEKGRLCPVGVAGELHIGGAQLAQGYHERAELTAKRFVPDGYAREVGARLYRTGDRARWRSDGVVEFLGRLDAQVKVRGYRIELAEVEAALRELEGVKDAAVGVHEETPGDRRLVGYVVPRAGAAWEPEGLKEALGRKLPEYMVPPALVRLEALPLTPSGKVARAKLPAPDLASLRGVAPFVAPRDTLETQLAEAFASVLKLPRVSVTDSFFSLGGHSLLATQAMARIRHHLRRELPLRMLFEAPSVAALARRIEAEMPPLESRAPTPMRARTRFRNENEQGDTEEEMLSFAQQRLWFLDQYRPGSPLYNIPAALRLKGALDVPALEQAFTELVRRHQSLRTVFQSREGRPMQVISRSAPPRILLSVQDLAPLSESERETEAHRRAWAEARRPFDLTRGPLLRTALLRLGAREHLLLVTLHHIIADAWSIAVLIREVVTLYEAFSEGRRSPLPELAIQYADYAVQQREWLQGDVLERQLNWWRKQLDGVPAMLELPTDRPRPVEARNPGAVLKVDLSRELTRSLVSLCQREGATLFMGLLAGLQALLARYSGQDDICVGAPIAGRQQMETEGLIGFFVNTLVLRTRLDGDPTFRELLGRVRETTLGAYSHQDVPFEKLVEVLQPERQPGHTPFFQVAMVLLNTPPMELSTPGLSFEAMDVDSGTSKFDFTLMLRETPTGLTGTLEYRTDLYEPASAERFVVHLERLLEGAVANPLHRVSELPLVSDADRRLVLEDWNATSTGPRWEVCAHELVEAQARRTPEAVAVVWGGEALTYAELERRANQLAWHLGALGVGAGERVGLCMERSLEQLVGLLGILKAGAAYVPLDAKYPAERLEYMVEDGGVARVLTTKRQLGALPAGVKKKALCVDEEAGEVARRPEIAPPRAVPPGGTCYVVYTSGSTGKPKGVALSHAALCNLLLWQRAHSVKAEARTLQFASLSFDVSFQEIFATWSAGGTLVVPPAALRQDVPALLDFMASQGVERLFVPFVALQALADAVAHGARVPESLREVVTAGEQLQVTPAVVAFFEKLPGCVLENQYGPSETHVVSAYRLKGPAGSWPRLPPIGVPLPDTKLLVLDEKGRLCPVGVAGELHIGGAQLAQGYHERAELTAKRFVPDGYAREVGARLYRTGDRARWRSDGVVEFLGRLDAQVKVRGYRIELAEVEAALRELEGVKDAAVGVHEETPGDRRLVGYVVPRAGAAWEPEGLKEALGRKLPEYMVPPALVRLEALPLTPSGKVARAKLPAPDLASLRGVAPFVAPRDTLETQLAEAFASVLKLPRVSVTDSFFSLGGHSLLATQVVARIRHRLKADIHLTTLFEAPSVAALARRIEAAPRAPLATLPPIVPASRDKSVPLSYSQERLWKLFKANPQSTAYNQPAAYRFKGALNPDALRAAVQALVDRHESLRTTFTEEAGQPVQKVAATLRIDLPLEDFRAREDREEEVLRRIAEDARKPFDLTQGPLVRGGLIRLADDEYLFIFSKHHILSDGWSESVITREVVHLYTAFARGSAPSLPPLVIQYPDYAAWQRRWLSGVELESRLSYWRNALAKAPKLLELPLDKPRPPTRTFNGTWIPVSLGRARSDALNLLCQRERVTPFMALLSLFGTLLCRRARQEELVIGSPIANRALPEVESLIGLFVNTVALNVDVRGNPSFRQLLARVRDVTLGAYAHQEVPIDQVVDTLVPQRQQNRAPLFQVMFVLQNTPAESLELPELTLMPMPSDRGASIYELTLSLQEQEDGFSGLLEFNTDLFEPDTARRLCDAFSALLDAALATPDMRVGIDAVIPGFEGQE
nr:non-ribosomal peptide synthetase [Myxococcus sp. XM-1-1-1]